MSPIYEYECQHGHRVQRAQSMGAPNAFMNEPTVPDCPEGRPKGTMCRYERVMSAPSAPVVRGGTPKHHT